MEALVEEGKVVGCMAQITQDGETIFLEAVGDRSPESDEDVRTDQVIRIYSMTKAITSVAIMQLVEQGKLGIDDPVSIYIPEFKSSKVLVNGKLEPTIREVTIRDLLTHTSGLPYLFGVPKESSGYFEDTYSSVSSLEDAVKNIANVPLADQPGSAFVYGLNNDVLGRVVEVVSGDGFEAYLQNNIFTPLSMRNTSFTPDTSMTQMPIVTLIDGSLTIDGKHYERGPYEINPSYPSGGGGLWSTIGDYTRFCMAIEQEGTLKSNQILRPETVAFMTQNHISPGTDTSGLQLSKHFGLGFALGESLETSTGLRGAGRWTWGGAACTYFFIDPAQDVTAVFATQLFPFNFALNTEFHQAVLESLVQND